MNRITLLLAVFTLTAVGDIAAKERVYTWTDKDGTVHFSDQPLGQQVTPMLVSPSRGNPAAAAGQVASDPKKPGANDDEAVFVGNPDEDPKVRAKNCEQSRNFVTAIKEGEGRRLYVNKEDGTRHWLTDEERAQKLEAGEKAVKKWCD